MIKGLIFLGGAAVGAIITFFTIKASCEEYIKNEVESVRRHFEKMDEDLELKAEEAKVTQEKPDLSEYASMVCDLGYDGGKNGDETHLISSLEFGEKEAYGTVSYTYYSDGVITDSDNSPIEDVFAAVGSKVIGYLDEHPEEDCVYVRNDKTMLDIEILRDYAEYNPDLGELKND